MKIKCWLCDEEFEDTGLEILLTKDSENQPYVLCPVCKIENTLEEYKKGGEKNVNTTR